MSPSIDPDQRAFAAHRRSARFLAGVDAGRWRVVKSEWPIVLVAVAAAPRPGSPAEYFLRLTADGYPTAGITAAPWDPEADTLLAAEDRPTGEIAGHVFRSDWNGGTALYAPWDRVALPGHTDWPTTHPTQVWTPARDLTFFLECVWEVLNSDDYKGKAVAQAA
jgi:hypothetical protein